METTEEIINNNDKLSFVEFLNTVKWLVIFCFKLSPFTTICTVTARIFLDLSPLFTAYIFARLLDKIIKIATSSSPNLNDVIPLLGLLLLVNLIISALDSAYLYFMDVMSDLTVFKAPQILYKHIHSLGIQTLENPEVANKVQRSKEILYSLDTSFSRVITFISRIITSFSALFIIFKIMPTIAIIIFIALVPGLISNRYYMKKSWKLVRDETENKRRSSFIFDSLIETSNLQEITITSAYGYLSNIYNYFTHRFMLADLKIYKDWQTYGFLFGSITEIASIFGYFSILKNLFNKLISVGDVTFQMRSLDIFISNLQALGSNYSSLYERCIRVNEVKQVFDMKPMLADGLIELPIFEIAPKIKFDKVVFKYPNADRFTIKNLSLEIKPGEKIAIVGENGAGKTTLVKLLARFYKVSDGEIFLNDNNIDDVKISSWYKNLSVLFQDYNTYSALTLKENIYLGKSDEKLDENKIKIAAQRANVDSFIGNYKKGYDQVLSEKFKGGTRPSTGQWQKIAIARFFYRNSPVIVFDEPTASIDAVSEAEIFGQIYDFFKDKTVIIISHRFSTVRNADKIYVLADGEIVESGSHTQLMKLKGNYYKAFNVQAKGYK